MVKRLIISIFIVAFFLLTGCGSKDLVVLLPEQDGKVGQLTVSNPKGTQVLSQANQASEIASADAPPGVPRKMKEKEISNIFGKALEAQPQPPVHFMLYFQHNSTKLTDKSSQLVPEIINSIKERKSVDTSVVGHADTSGDKKYNYQLSRRRAVAVSKILISHGVDRNILEITSHGEEAPFIKTKDGAIEPRNRRVEVTVR